MGNVCINLIVLQTWTRSVCKMFHPFFFTLKNIKKIINLIYCQFFRTFHNKENKQTQNITQNSIISGLYIAAFDVGINFDLIFQNGRI